MTWVILPLFLEKSYSQVTHVDIFVQENNNLSQVNFIMSHLNKKIQDLPCGEILTLLDDLFRMARWNIHNYPKHSVHTSITILFKENKDLKLAHIDHSQILDQKISVVIAEHPLIFSFLKEICDLHYEGLEMWYDKKVFLFLKTMYLKNLRAGHPHRK